MATFTDKQGEQWQIDLNFGTVRNLKKITNIDLVEDKVGDKSASVLLVGDPYTQADLLWGLCKSQAEENGITEEQFYQRLPYQEAEAAFWKEWENFFQSLGRTERAEALAAIRKAQAKAVEMVTEKVRAVDVETVVSGKLSGVSLDI